MLNQNLLLADDGYNIQRSLRFRSSASAYLNRTPASAGNRKTWTWSGWVKRGALGANAPIFQSGNPTSPWFLAQFETDNTFQVSFSAGVSGGTYTTQVFRDSSAWYHIVIAVDTTQATASNRLKLYVNGSQITAFSSTNYPALNFDTQVNNTISHTIGAFSTNAFDGYLTEVNFIDGQALTPSSFGQTNSATGVWQPIKYSGTYGTNGFYLNFSDNSNNTATTIGKDYSGNGNNWTPNNISVTSGATYDSMTDVPTLTSATAANYCVLNPLSKGANVSATNGNLNAVISGASAESLQSTLGMFSGKWYCEMTAGGGGSIFGITTVGANLSSWVGSDTKGYGYRGDTGAVMYNGSALVSGMSTFASGDVISLAFDADAGKLWFAKNGTWYNSGSPSAGTNATVSSIASGNWFVSVGRINTTNDAQLNFGQQPFAYTPPTGFVALNTFNLPTPTIGATASSQANRYMDVLTWTGDGASSRAITGLNFQPDWVWDKMRSGAYQHAIVDSVRGGNQVLHSNSTSSEDTNWQYGYVSSFNSNGFTIQAGATSSENWNLNGSTFVAWNWNAGGSTVTNTSGSITSQVRANTTAGFSIVTFTNQTSGTATVGHGLGVAPKFVIVKGRNYVSGWNCYHSGLTSANYYIALDGTGAQVSNNTFWNNTDPTSTVFSLGSAWSGSSITSVAYCFSAVAGYSAFGSYTGNGSTDGPFVFTGFRPRFVIIKGSDYAGADWVMYDAARNTYNALTSELNPNSSASENNFSGAARMDFLSNGIKIKTAGAGLNASGYTYIYMAFAESPFKYSLAR